MSPYPHPRPARKRTSSFHILTSERNTPSGFTPAARLCTCLRALSRGARAHAAHALDDLEALERGHDGAARGARGAARDEVRHERGVEQRVRRGGHARRESGGRHTAACLPRSSAAVLHTTLSAHIAGFLGFAYTPRNWIVTVSLRY
jgi:hypothetical protein